MKFSNLQKSTKSNICKGLGKYISNVSNNDEFECLKTLVFNSRYLPGVDEKLKNVVIESFFLFILYNLKH
jgi:hypothetical protein